MVDLNVVYKKDTRILTEKKAQSIDILEVLSH